MNVHTCSHLCNHCPDQALNFASPPESSLTSLLFKRNERCSLCPQEALKFLWDKKSEIPEIVSEQSLVNVYAILFWAGVLLSPFGLLKQSYRRLGNLNNKCLFLLWRLQSPRSRCRQIQGLVRTQFLVHRRLSSPCVLTWWKG